MKIRVPDIISNISLLERTNQSSVSHDVKRRKWGWIGHILRKPPDNITRRVLEWSPQGKRRVGRPKQAWRRSVESEAKRTGLSWAQLKSESDGEVCLRPYAPLKGLQE